MHRKKISNARTLRASLTPVASSAKISCFRKWAQRWTQNWRTFKHLQQNCLPKTALRVDQPLCATSVLLFIDLQDNTTLSITCLRVQWRSCFADPGLAKRLIDKKSATKTHPRHSHPTCVLYVCGPVQCIRYSLICHLGTRAAHHLRAQAAGPVPAHDCRL